MDTRESTGNTLLSNDGKKNREMKVVQYTLPKSLCQKFKSVCSDNGEYMVEVVERLMKSYIKDPEVV